jgi:hypothetical protein
MGLKPAKYSASYLSVRRKAAELDREGQSLKAIARYFNEQGFASPSGKSWTRFMVEHLLHTHDQKQESLESIHRRAITEARVRGLNYGQMADEFNTKNIRRRGGRPWTAKSVAIRCSDLNCMQRKREQKELSDTKVFEPIVLKRTAWARTQQQTAVIYARVSSEEEVQGYSIQAQLRACREWAEKHGWTVAKEYLEEGRSAFRHLEKREALKELLADTVSKQRGFHLIIIHKLDRLFRDPLESSNVRGDPQALKLRYAVSVGSIDRHCCFSFKHGFPFGGVPKLALPNMALKPVENFFGAWLP